jgi:hypothetical protein
LARVFLSLGACTDHRDRARAKEEHLPTSPGFLNAIFLQDQKKFDISCPPLQTKLSDRLQCGFFSKRFNAFAIFFLNP